MITVERGTKGWRKSDMDYNRGEMKESEGGKKAGDVRVEEGENREEELCCVHVND